ncbi:MAG: FtsX-like permease family protein [candidate division Zixibacteria bacterium]|nr:FtsX-like permease family protein [candidate division Zixibacteria bacterium]
MPVQYKDAKFTENNVLYADNSIFEVFSFPFIRGNSDSALARANTIVITEETAFKYFGTENPIGRSLRIGTDDDFLITGIMENVPSNSHFKFDMLLSFETLIVSEAVSNDGWTDFAYFTYLLLDKNANPSVVETKLVAFVDSNVGEILKQIGGSITFFLQPLTDIHLYSKLSYEIPGGGSIEYVYLFSVIALFVLMIACFNFICLATGRSMSRAKEIAMRKTLGAVRGKLIIQFLGESVIYSLLSLMIALMLVELMLPFFSDLSQRQLVLHWFEPFWLLGGFVLIAIVIGIVAGAYPAFFLSALRPIQVLKGSFGSLGSGSILRRILVTTQFVISITLLIGTIVVYNQINYMKEKELGFQKDQIVVLPEVQNSVGLIKQELNQVPGVLAVSSASDFPGETNSRSLYIPEGFTEDQAQIITHIGIDYKYIPTLEIELVSGRNFSPDYPSDTNKAVIINQMTANSFGWENPIGKTIRSPLGSNGTDSEGNIRTVVGVVKDFHFVSLQNPIEPLLMGYDSNAEEILIRIKPTDVKETIAGLGAMWSKIIPENSFNYFFLDKRFEQNYLNEERLGKITLSFSLLAILVACLGLFGLTSYSAERRTREIGIRKVLGASVPGIIRLLCREFLILVVIANIVAWPIAYFAMKKWLQTFAYKIELGLHIFILVGVMALMIAFATIGYQAIKAARANPVKALKHE